MKYGLWNLQRHVALVHLEHQLLVLALVRGAVARRRMEVAHDRVVQEYAHLRVNMCIDMCKDIRIDVQEYAHLRIDMRIDMHRHEHRNAYGHAYGHAGICTAVNRHAYGHVCRHALICASVNGQCVCTCV